jgi:hypothetical protein
MRPNRPLLRLLLLLLAFGASAPVATGCSVSLVSRYDEQIDRTATRLQRMMDAFLTRLENLPANDAERGYPANKEFYLQYGVDLRSLKVRASSLERSSITVEQVERMEASLEQLRSAHESQNRLSPPAIREFRNLFNIAWTAILTFELAKKR